jgi:uncharacterized protein (TIGR02679 family)
VSALPERLAAPGLAPIWGRARRAMAVAGAAWESVRITVPLVDDDQRRAVAGLLGRVVRPGTASVGVALGDLDARVRRPGDGWDLRAVVEATGGPVPDRRADAARRATAVDRAVADARAVGPDAPWFRPWLEGLAADGTVARLVGRGEADAVGEAAVVLAALPLAGEPLPAVAARLTRSGDTKALNSGPLAGLVLRGVATMLGEERPRAAAARRALWEAVGVVADDLASQVLVLNLPVRATSPGLGAWLADAAQVGEPLRVTLHQLTRWGIEPATDAQVHVCENPAVVRAAAHTLGVRAAPLVCTEGRPSVAAVRLLDGIAAAGSALLVRADFDWAGLRIAGSLLDRPGARPWRFTTDDYEAALDRRSGRAAAGLSGAPAPSPWDPGLALALDRTGEVVYEEEMLDDLVGDLA